MKAQQKRDAIAAGEHWEEDDEMQNEDYDLMKVTPDERETIRRGFHRRMFRREWGATFEQESLLGSGYFEGDVPARVMAEEFKDGKELNPLLGVDKGQFLVRLEKDVDLIAPVEYPHPTTDGGHIKDYKGMRGRHRGLANEQTAEVIKKARARKLELEKGLKVWVLDQKNVHKVITTGMEESTVVLMLVGNGKGAAGYGIGKAPDLERATIRAKVNAERDMIALDRFDRRTIYHALHGKHNGSQCIIRPLKRGTGLMTGDLLNMVCDCFGITDISGKMIGNRNVYSQIQAIFKAFIKHRSYEDMAWARGRRVRDIGIWSVTKKKDRDDFGGMMRLRDKI